MAQENYLRIIWSNIFYFKIMLTQFRFKFIATQFILKMVIGENLLAPNL
jgi:hypothetical protein